MTGTPSFIVAKLIELDILDLLSQSQLATMNLLVPLIHPYITAIIFIVVVVIDAIVEADQ